MEFHEARLPNGLQVIAELSQSVQSVAVSFFVRTGSRDETSPVSGVSHFLEHMAFKGTEQFSAEDVNRIFDELGARYNASTSEEITLFYAAILPEYLKQTMELLAGIIQPSLRESDFDMEKNVILEEIGMYEDQPTFVAYEKVMQAHFAGHPLGRSILGTTESITALTAEQMRTYHRERYRAGNIVLAVAGKTSWEEVLALAEQYCSHWPEGTPERIVEEAKPVASSHIIQRESSLQQHIMQMTPAPAARNALRYPADVLSVIVGDDSGSRLYWELVEPGHAESAELGYNEFDGSGVYLTYLGCDPEEAEANLERVRKVFDKVNREGITEVELAQAKNKICSRIVLRSERPMGRLSSLGNNWIYRGEYRPVAADLETVRNITTNDIRELLKAYPLGGTTTVTIGPLAENAFTTL